MTKALCFIYFSLFDRANVWIGGTLKKLPSGSELQLTAEATTDLFISVPSVERVLLHLKFYIYFAHHNENICHQRDIFQDD